MNAIETINKYIPLLDEVLSVGDEFFRKKSLERVKEMAEGTSKKYRPIGNFYDFAADFGNIRHEGGVAFNGGKKPTKMLRQFLCYHQRKDITVLDLFYDEKFNDISQEKYNLYMVDPVHPKRAGYREWWVPAFENCLKKLFINLKNICIILYKLIYNK